MRGPERRTYYDMNPWYQKNREQGIHDWHQHVRAADERLLKVVKDSCIGISKVLEVGCGGGDFTLSYSTEGLQIDAFEYSDVAIEMAMAKLQAGNVNFYQGDALETGPYEKGPYDLVLAKDVLHCILGKDRKTFFNHLNRSVTAAGRVILTTHVGLPKNEEVLKFVDLETRENHLSTRAYLDEEDIDREIVGARFRIDRKEELPGQLRLYILGKK